MGATATTAGRVRKATPDDLRLKTASEVERRISTAMWMAHTLGALDLFALLFFVLPLPDHASDPRTHLIPNLVGFVIYLPVASAVGHYFGVRMGASRSAWLRDGRDPDPEERARVIVTPLHCARMCAGLWAGGALLFGLINLAAGWPLALHVSCTILLGGLTTCAVSYLLVERLQRPITAMVLAAGPAPAPRWPGVEGRLTLAWLCATGVPVLGIAMVAIDGLSGHASGAEIARATLVLALAALAIGLAVTIVAARSVAHPLTGLRRALGRVQAGDLAVEVQVDDASEVGQLQSGFNRMVAGLRERERVQDLYSRQVGADVARAAIDDSPSLGGEVREVAVLFIDLIGSTALAHNAPPQRVVARLNRFFAVVVDVVGRHGGWVNKFEGDAALCVFGAPAPQVDSAGCALAAARELRQRMGTDLPGVEAGIGLSAGPAVAGWVGAEQRFEYTVIGDPVNEAARLCELAKRGDVQLLASAAMLSRCDAGEAARWELGEETQLRGRAAPTRVAAPIRG
jgi:adenylate cyclase